ncbi:MAG: methylenetetrahydrofolate reductase, partial [Chloroflexi bacterium]|nr:methylenetetrahydrofolate reductase [Chloroflexota bacterium]
MKAVSRLERLLENGTFVVTAELGPPKGPDSAVIVKKAGLLRGACDAVNITDNQTAIVRMSSAAASALLVQQGLEPIMQMTCRDRNRLAIQADLFGAAALGIRNVLCLTGDHQVFGNHPGSKNVYDLDSVQLIGMTRRLRDEGLTLGGDPVEGAMPLFIGGAANPFGDPFELQVLRVAKKAAAGVQFIQTQCIFDIERFHEWMKRIVDLGVAEKV